MLYKRVNDIFHNLGEWNNPEKSEHRRLFIKKIISDYDMIILQKISELCPDWPIDVLGWAYCSHGPMQRKKIIDGYKDLIKEINSDRAVVLA